MMKGLEAHLIRSLSAPKNVLEYCFHFNVLSGLGQGMDIIMKWTFQLSRSAAMDTCFPCIMHLL